MTTAAKAHSGPMPYRPVLSVALILLAAVALPCAGCRSDPPPPAPDAFCKEFSGQRAFDHVAKLVAFGPRPSGSPELEQSRQYIEGQLRTLGWTIEQQKFTDSTPHGPIEFVNLIARPAGASPDEAHAIVCTHYDTKFYDAQRFVGADDGGSGTGALIELARVLALNKDFARKFELVFFDGEEAIREFRYDAPPYDGLWGSRHYAHALSASGRAKQFKLGVLWDMIGKNDLTITMPPDSPSKLAQGIFAASNVLGTRSHFGYSRGDILDDHYDLNHVGIPTIDLIDFNFPAWHTPGDTLDKVGPESLQIVGQATLYHLCKVGQELR